MASLNKVMLIGNLTRDPELKYTQGGSPYAKFGLAINRKFKQQDEWKEDVCFVDVTAWGTMAENCSKYLSKGSPVFIEGRLNFNSWQTDAGEKKSKLEVVANNIQFLGSKQSDVLESADKPLPSDEIPF